MAGMVQNSKDGKFPGQPSGAQPGAQPAVPVLLAGGKGTRLWPMSRSSRPKQFLPLSGDISLFQQALLRVNDPERYAPAIIVTNEEYRFLAAEQAAECGVTPGAILLEPTARNTAPAIAAACAHILKQGQDRLVHVLPCDHDFAIEPSYLEALEAARQAARSGRLMTFGITPSSPATCFGYIVTGKTDKGAEASLRPVARFVEKPELGTARNLLAKGNCYWNSGMFMFLASAFLKECEKLCPQVRSSALLAVEQARDDLDFIRLAKDEFVHAPDVSADYAIFEKTKRAWVVPLSLSWSDLGTWEAVWKAGQHDEQGNVTRGGVSLNATAGSLVISEQPHVVVEGMKDVCVIAGEDAVYVSTLSRSGELGTVVEKLKKDPRTRPLTQTHRTDYRPWGGFSLVVGGERFQVKKLFVKPGKSLSLQKHHHRAEHWIVVNGTAEVQIDGKTTLLKENESIYIPQGAVHRLENPGKILLELIEVQTGSYFGEDDIIRLEDAFGRV